jgi:hypothetical protein
MNTAQMLQPNQRFPHEMPQYQHNMRLGMEGLRDQPSRVALRDSVATIDFLKPN